MICDGDHSGVLFRTQCLTCTWQMMPMLRFVLVLPVFLFCCGIVLSAQLLLKGLIPITKS